MADAAAYHRQLEAARRVGLTMTKSQADAFVRLLEQYAEELASRVAAGLATRGERYALEVAREIIQQLVRDMALATRNGVTVTANRVATLYAEATASLLATQPGGGTAVALFQGLGTSAAQAVLSRPELAASFRTIRRKSIAAVDQIIPRGMLRGATSTQLAKELRLHILGADAFPPGALLDRRRIGYDVLRQMGYQATPTNLRLVRANAGVIAGKAQLIARTEPMNAEWEAHRQGAIESDVVAAIAWELSSAHPHVDECDALQDTDFYGLGPGRYPPELLPRRPHPRCFLPGTRVSGSFVRAFRAEYSGDVLEIETVGGQKLTVTPNHPILTPRGFVPADKLVEGSQLLCYRPESDRVGVVSASHEGQAPSPIEQVFAALREAGTVATHERSPEDLHGDAAHGQGDIDVVGADWELERGPYAPGFEQLGQPPFVLPDVAFATIPGAGGTLASLAAVGAAALRGSSGLAHPSSELGVGLEASLHVERLGLAEPPDAHSLALEVIDQSGAADAGSLGHALHRLTGLIKGDQPPQIGDFQALRFGPAAHLDASVFQPAADGVSGGAKLLADLRRRCSSLVLLDQVRNVTRMRYSGHVYDLQATNGVVVAEGIIASNCICRHRDILRPPEEWGEPKPETPERRLEPSDVARAMGLSPSRTRSLRAAVVGTRPAPRSRPQAISDAHLLTKVIGRENEIRHERIEWGTLWDAKTGQVLLNKTEHKPNEIGFTDDEIALFANNIFTHNHPSGSSFSHADIFLTLQANLQELRAAGRYYTYSIRRPDDGWPAASKLQALGPGIEADLRAEMWARIDSGELTPDQAGLVHQHELWTRVFDAIGLPSVYTRTRAP